jgi:hypothetical protein
LSRIVAIHQPNFFPWLGFFDKARRADVFVLLDGVAYSRGSWSNRVRINVRGAPHWIGCNVRRMPLGTLISEIHIDESSPWRVKLLKTLDANYRRAHNYDCAMCILEPLIRNPEANLAAFNTQCIRTLAGHLGVTPKFVLHSELETSSSGTRLLVEITKAIGADTYLAGGGASGYQEDELFEASGLKLIQQKFVPATYGVPDRFIPGLSVIDYLMQDGRPLSEAFPSDRT